MRNEIMYNVKTSQLLFAVQTALKVLDYTNTFPETTLTEQYIMDMLLTDNYDYSGVDEVLTMELIVPIFYKALESMSGKAQIGYRLLLSRTASHRPITKEDFNRLIRLMVEGEDKGVLPALDRVQAEGVHVRKRDMVAGC